MSQEEPKESASDDERNLLLSESQFFRDLKVLDPNLSDRIINALDTEKLKILIEDVEQFHSWTLHIIVHNSSAINGLNQIDCDKLQIIFNNSFRINQHQLIQLLVNYEAINAFDSNKLETFLGIKQMKIWDNFDDRTMDDQLYNMIIDDDIEVLGNYQLVWMMNFINEDKLEGFLTTFMSKENSIRRILENQNAIDQINLFEIERFCLFSQTQYKIVLKILENENANAINGIDIEKLKLLLNCDDIEEEAKVELLGNLGAYEVESINDIDKEKFKLLFDTGMKQQESGGDNDSAVWSDDFIIRTFYDYDDIQLIGNRGFVKLLNLFDGERFELLSVRKYNHLVMNIVKNELTVNAMNSMSLERLTMILKCKRLSVGAKMELLSFPNTIATFDTINKEKLQILLFGLIANEPVNGVTLPHDNENQQYIHDDNNDNDDRVDQGYDGDNDDFDSHQNDNANGLDGSMDDENYDEFVVGDDQEIDFDHRDNERDDLINYNSNDDLNYPFEDGDRMFWFDGQRGFDDDLCLGDQDDVDGAEGDQSNNTGHEHLDCHLDDSEYNDHMNNQDHIDALDHFDDHQSDNAQDDLDCHLDDSDFNDHMNNQDHIDALHHFGDHQSDNAHDDLDCHLDDSDYNDYMNNQDHIDALDNSDVNVQDDLDDSDYNDHIHNQDNNNCRDDSDYHDYEEYINDHGDELDYFGDHQSDNTGHEDLVYHCDDSAYNDYLNNPDIVDALDNNFDDLEDLDYHLDDIDHNDDIDNFDDHQSDNGQDDLVYHFEDSDSADNDDSYYLGDSDVDDDFYAPEDFVDEFDYLQEFEMYDGYHDYLQDEHSYGLYYDSDGHSYDDENDSIDNHFARDDDLYTNYDAELFGSEVFVNAVNSFEIERFKLIVAKNRYMMVRILRNQSAVNAINSMAIEKLKLILDCRKLGGRTRIKLLENEDSIKVMNCLNYQKLQIAFQVINESDLIKIMESSQKNVIINLNLAISLHKAGKISHITYNYVLHNQAIHATIINLFPDTFPIDQILVESTIKEGLVPNLKYISLGNIIENFESYITAVDDVDEVNVDEARKMFPTFFMKPNLRKVD